MHARVSLTCNVLFIVFLKFSFLHRWIVFVKKKFILIHRIRLLFVLQSLKYKKYDFFHCLFCVLVLYLYLDCALPISVCIHFFFNLQHYHQCGSPWWSQSVFIRYFPFIKVPCGLLENVLKRIGSVCHLVDHHHVSALSKDDHCLLHYTITILWSSLRSCIDYAILSRYPDICSFNFFFPLSH